MLGNSGPWLVCNDLWSMVDIFYFLVYITFCSWVSIGMLLVAMSFSKSSASESTS